MRITAAGNVGIGTTTPNWLLDIAGSLPSIDLSDTSAGNNLKHWLFSSMGGNLYIGTSTDAFSTSTIPALTIQNSGKTGIATTTFSGLFGLGTYGSTNGTSTLAAGKIQWDGYDSGGTRRCWFFNTSGTLTSSTGACNQ
jgi:hypothetical protein